MKNNVLQSRFAARTMLIIVLFSIEGLAKAYDFSQVNSWGGQMLYYNIIDATNHYVEITYPGPSTSNPWPYNKPIGGTALPESVEYNGITYTVTEVGDYAFYMCSDLTCVIISSTIVSIGDYAFYECSGLTGELTIPNSVVAIGNRAFSNCNKLTGPLVIPDSVISIGYQAFLDCIGFTSLTMGNSLTTIGWGAFNTCYNISGQLVFPESVISIGGDAFRECYAITSIFIPNSVIELGYNPYIGATNPFPSCSSIGQILVAVDNPVFDSRENCNAIINSNTNELITGCKNSFIPNSVTSVGRYAFGNNLGLTSLVFGSSVTSIGDFAFYNCANLTTMSIMAETPPSVGSYCFLNVPNSISINVPCGSASAYQTANGWSYFTNYYETCSFAIAATPFPAEGGVVEGAGEYTDGEICTLIAIANEGFYFNNWTENGDVVSTEAIYSFTITGDRTIIANFIENQNVGCVNITIQGYGDGTGKWRFISSPLAGNTVPIVVDNMITETNYDLYCFNQSALLEWQNYKANAFELVNGQGYLYANAEDVNLVFMGTFNENSTERIGLTYDEGQPFAGWNLVGNPFPVNAYTNRSYYVMNEDGTAIEPVAVSMETAIPVCTGVMVKTTTSGQSITFSKTAPSSQGSQGVLQIAIAKANVRGNAIQDNAIVSFNEGDELCKFVFNKDNAQLYIPQGDEDFAIAYAKKQGEMPLNFEAKENGNYTISVNPESVEMNYLHLIDNMTGTDIDLLSTPSYTFESKTTDYVFRFRLVFSASGNTDDE